MARCQKCGKFCFSWREFQDGTVICYECYDKIKNEQVQSKKDAPQITINPKQNFRDIMTIFAIISFIIFIIAGIWMFLISAAVDSIMLEFYHSFGLFVIGIGFFIGPLLYGIGVLVDKK